MPTQYKILALIVALIVSGSAGWAVRGWKDDSANLEAVQAARKEEQAIAAKQAEVSQKTIVVLQAQKAKTRIIYREISKLPNPERQCFDDSAISLLNAAAQNIPPPSPDPLP